MDQDVSKGRHMARGEERQQSLSELKRDAEHTREEFAVTADRLRTKVTDTVSDFRERASPAAIKAEVGDYFRTRGDLLLEKARQNPLQAVAIGVGLAYPLMSVVRSIPAPVLMIGAGLFLMGSSPGQRIGQKLATASDDLTDRARSGADALTRTLQEGQERLAEGVDSAKRAVSLALETARQQASMAGAGLSDVVDDFKEMAQRTANSSDSTLAGGLDHLHQKASASIDAVAGVAQGGAVLASTAAQDALNAATDFGAETARKASETSRRAVAILSEAIGQNPLLAGGLGFAIGALVASSIPVSEIEKGVLGEAGTEAKKRANEMASQGYDAAKDIAATVYGDIAKSAEEEGLTARGFQSAGEEIGRRVRKVAQTATASAFEAPSPERNSTDVA
jgi:hypothetical protein